MGSAVYFAGVMVRLMLTLTPCVCILAAIAFSKLFSIYLKEDETPKDDDPETNEKNGRLYDKAGKIRKMKHEQTGGGNDGSRQILDDFREAYYWLWQNTAEDARVMSWWDYGYQIAGMANRTTLVDNNTWNNSHIALVGKAMSSNESAAYDIMTELDVDYVLVIFGGVIGYSGDDINKFLWMVRIAEGEHPQDIKESDYFTERGEFRVDSEGSPTLLNCLMYKLSY